MAEAGIVWKVSASHDVAAAPATESHELPVSINKQKVIPCDCLKGRFFIATGVIMK